MLIEFFYQVVFSFLSSCSISLSRYCRSIRGGLHKGLVFLLLFFLLFNGPIVASLLIVSAFLFLGMSWWTETQVKYYMSIIVYEIRAGFSNGLYDSFSRLWLLLHRLTKNIFISIKKLELHFMKSMFLLP